MRGAGAQLELDGLLQRLFCGTLTEDDAARLAGLGPEVVTLALLAANARFAQLQSPSVSPSTPSGQTPVHEKAFTPRRRKKPGAKQGHVGSHRKTPAAVDERVEHRLEVCPC